MSLIEQDYRSIQATLNSNAQSITFLTGVVASRQALITELLAAPVITEAVNYVQNIFVIDHVHYLTSAVAGTAGTENGRACTYTSFYSEYPAGSFPNLLSYTANITGFLIKANVAYTSPVSSGVVTYERWGDTSLQIIQAPDGTTYNGMDVLSTINITRIAGFNKKIQFLGQYLNGAPGITGVSHSGGYGLRYELTQTQAALSLLSQQQTFLAAKKSNLAFFLGYE